MISRRSLFGMLASLPVVGKAFADAPVPEAIEAGPPVSTSLPAIRDYLRPGLWSWAERHGLEAEILVQFASDSLLVIACYPPSRSQSFCITRTSIDSNLYLKEFEPNLAALRMRLDEEAFASDPRFLKA